MMRHVLHQTACAVRWDASREPESRSLMFTRPLCTCHTLRAVPSRVARYSAVSCSAFRVISLGPCKKIDL
eukprot:6213787-Pleurochrysis_carterae.AAC.3